MSQLMRNILVWLAISGITFVAIQNIYNQTPSQNMNYSEFVSLVNKDQISQVSFKGDGYTIEGITQEGNSFTTTRPIYCLLYTSPSPRDKRQSRMPSSA